MMLVQASQLSKRTTPDACTGRMSLDKHVLGCSTLLYKSVQADVPAKALSASPT
jgi:hypothetical protein